MKYNDLQATKNKDRKRVGRGIAAGQGKTAGRGTKGQGARTGKKLHATFMGGQGALMQRVPKKRGFKSMRVPAQVVYVSQLSELKSATVDNQALFEAGLIATPYHTVKVIAGGEYKGKVNLRVQAASASVRELLEKNGGSFEATPVPELPASNQERAEKKAERAEKKAAKSKKSDSK